MRLHILLAICVASAGAVAHKKARQATTTDDVGDDYSDFSSQPVKNAGANHELKQVTYSTIAPKYDIPTRQPLLNPNPIGQNPVQATTKKPVVVDYRRGYYFQHYPWDRLPRRYLLRPGMTYVYPPQYQYASYRYPYLPATYTDPYNIYRSHPGIGGGCGQSGCGGGYPQGYGGYQGYGSYSGGCGGGSGTGCGGYDDEEDEDSYEDEEEEGGKSGEAKINKKDPLEDLELEDLEKLSKSSDDGKSSSSDTSEDVEPTPIKKAKMSDDEDLVDDRKKTKKNFLIKWA